MKYYKLIDILQQIAGDEDNYIQILQGRPVETGPTQQPADPKAQNNGPPQRPTLPQRPRKKSVQAPDGTGFGAELTKDMTTVPLFDQNANQGENANSKDPHRNLKEVLLNKQNGNIPDIVNGSGKMQYEPGGSGQDEGTKKTEPQQPPGVTNLEAGNDGPTTSPTTNEMINELDRIAQNDMSDNKSNEHVVGDPNGKVTAVPEEKAETGHDDNYKQKHKSNVDEHNSKDPVTGKPHRRMMNPNLLAQLNNPENMDTIRENSKNRNEKKTVQENPSPTPPTSMADAIKRRLQFQRNAVAGNNNSDDKNEKNKNGKNGDEDDSVNNDEWLD